MPILPPYETKYITSLLSSPPKSHSPSINSTVETLSLLDHIEGGHFVETDRDPLLIPNPFKNLPQLANATAKDTSDTRHASTSIFYFLSPKSPVGRFHRNRGRTVHTLHWGRGRYVIIHFDQISQGRAPIETFIVGHDISKGERLQWIVDGGKFKASFLLPDDGKGESEKGLLISETVVPGFEYSDHNFMTAQQLVESLGEKEREELRWLLKPEEQTRLEEVVSQKDQ